MNQPKSESLDQNKIAPMWVLPKIYAGNVPVQKVYVYLVDLLTKAASDPSFHDILTNPGKYQVSHIRERIKRLIFQDHTSNDPTSLTGITDAANFLEQLLQHHPKNEPGQSFTSRQPTPNLFPTSIAASLRSVHDADRAFIGEIRGGLFQAQLSDEARVGAFLVCAVLRLGQVYLPALTELVLGATGKLKRAKSWLYLNIHIQGTSKRLQQERRVFLDPTSAAAFVQINPDFVLGFTQSASYAKSNSTQRRALVKTFLSRCYKSLLDAMSPVHKDKFPSSFSDLLTCKSDALFLQLPGWGLLYARGEVASTSLAESTFLRLLGCVPSEHSMRQDTKGGATRSDDIDINPSVLADSGLLPSLQDAGELDVAGFISKVHRCLRKSPEAALNAIDEGLRKMDPSSVGKNPEHILLEYLRSMVESIVLRHKHKRQVSTIRYMVGVFFTRFLACFQDHCEHGVTGEGLGELYIGIKELSASPGHEVQVVKVTRDFHHFFLRTYIKKYQLDIGPVSVDFSGSSGYSVSAHVLSHEEIRQVTDRLTSDLCRLRPEDRQRAALLANLGFYLGMRRSEMVFPLVRDLHFDQDPVFIVRANHLRTLKTANARRLLPMKMLPRRYCALAAEMAHEKSPVSLLLFDTSEQVSDRNLTDAIRQSLHEVTQNKSLHLHSLRHSCATWLFLGMHANDVGLKRYRGDLPFLDDVLSMGELAREQVYTRAHRQGGKVLAIATFFGHGSEFTTLGHYVHCMDLLHFSALDRSDDFYDGPTQRAALGLPKSSRLMPHAREQWAELLVSLFPDRFDCARPIAPIKQSDVSNAAELSQTQVSVRQLIQRCRWLNSVVLRGGEPLERCGVAMRSASSVVSMLNAAFLRNPAATLQALGLLEAKRHKHRHTACVSSDELRLIFNGLGLQGDAACNFLQVFFIERVQRLGKGSNTKKRELTGAEILQVLDDGGLDGTYWIMLRDGSPRNSKGLCRFSASQSAITGVAIAMLIHLQSESKELHPIGIPQIPAWLFKQT